MTQQYAPARHTSGIPCSSAMNFRCLRTQGACCVLGASLIAAFTGARITEIAQLLLDQLYEERGRCYFRIEGHSALAETEEQVVPQTHSRPSGVGAARAA